jgi:hypothetical protein
VAAFQEHHIFPQAVAAQDPLLRFLARLPSTNPARFQINEDANLVLLQPIGSETTLSDFILGAAHLRASRSFIPRMIRRHCEEPLRRSNPSRAGRRLVPSGGPQ